MTAMRTADQVVEDALYAEIFTLLESCTEDQVNGLWRIYGHVPRRIFPLKIPELRTVLALVQRTVRLNEHAAAVDARKEKP